MLLNCGLNKIVKISLFFALLNSLARSSPVRCALNLPTLGLTFSYLKVSLSSNLNRNMCDERCDSKIRWIRDG